MSYRIDNIGFGGYRIIQNPEHFCYGVDAVLLADFASRLDIPYRRAIDLGTGNGIIPLILSYKNGTADIIGIDILESNVEMARKSAKLNGIQERVSFFTLDVKRASEHIGKGCFQIVTCNPPYFPKGGGLKGNNNERYIARQETTAVIDDFIHEAALLLEEKGHFFMIHRPFRLVDIMHSCRENRLEPKEMKFVVPREGELPNMVLLHCIKGGGKELKILPTVNIHGNGDSYTEELLKIYEKC